MKQTKTNLSIKSIYHSIESWCESANGSSKKSARYFFAWTTTIILISLTIFGYIMSWEHVPTIGLTITIGIIIPVVLYHLIKWIRWVFSD